MSLPTPQQALDAAQAGTPCPTPSPPLPPHSSTTAVTAVGTLRWLWSISLPLGQNALGCSIPHRPSPVRGAAWSQSAHLGSRAQTSTERRNFNKIPTCFQKQKHIPSVHPPLLSESFRSFLCILSKYTNTFQASEFANRPQLQPLAQAPKALTRRPAVGCGAAMGAEVPGAAAAPRASCARSSREHVVHNRSAARGPAAQCSAEGSGSP